MTIIKLDSITFRLKEPQDFHWLKKYGKAFWCVDATGSGCICIGMENGEKRYFCKIAGANTVEAEVTPEESVAILKNAVSLYRELEHPNLIKLVEAYGYDRFYIAVFEWANGECLFDHWNFEQYKADHLLQSPKERFKALPVTKRLLAADVLFSFLCKVNRNGYVAVDFYDGSMMYDFAADKITLCDIDLFRKAPVVNDKGTEWYGTKRLKAPEEYIKGSAIDEQTNIFTLGALLFEIFGNYTGDEIRQRYKRNCFEPCAVSSWQLNKESYDAAVKAVSRDRDKRYKTLEEFYDHWKMANDC